MRITSSMYYDSIYSTNNFKLNKELFDVNKQIASGLKIQYASDNVSVFSQTMRLDNELTTIKQVKKSAQSGYKVSNQTDVTLNEFTKSIGRMRTLLLQAANDTNSATSLDSISSELRGIEKNLKSLANTSINGQYLFSGSNINTKPISENGIYNGNNVALNAFVGSNNKQQYNITGSLLFLGEEKLVPKEIMSNVVQKANIGTTIDRNTTIENLMGVVPAGRKHNFYLRGTKNDGTAINQKIQLDSSVTIDALLQDIGTAYGNNGTVKVVNVSINSQGQITVADKITGSSKLDFNLVGASDFGAVDDSNVTNIDSLATNGGTTDYNTALTNAKNLYIREFNKSGFTPVSGAPSIEGLVYDRTMFNVSGNSLTSNVAQTVKGSNAFATDSTKLVDVASGATLNGKQLKITGTDVSGNAINLQVDLKTSGSTFSLNGGVTNFNIYNAEAPRSAVNSDSMTYRQLMDVVNMAITNNLPAGNTATQYDTAVSQADTKGNTFLSYDGKISFSDLQFTTTKATMSIYDSNSGSFNANKASVMTFNTNNSLTVRDPKTDFFKTINDIVTAVENKNLYPDATSQNSRNVGIGNAIGMMDDLQNHLFRTQSTAGAQSNTLNDSISRTGILEISTATLRSEVVDTDLAKASLRLQQLTLNYQAMLSTVGKVSRLSLVNYL